jgi:hypothetical protein
MSNVVADNADQTHLEAEDDLVPHALWFSPPRTKSS